MQAHTISNVRSDLVRRDSSIPGLGLVLDPALLLENLGAYLDISQVEDIKLDYLRYKPGMNFLGRYQLRVAGSTIVAHAKAHGLDATDKISKSTERPVIDTMLGPGRVTLEQHHIIFSLFPNDAKLVSLQPLGNRKFRQRLLGRVFGSQSEWINSRVGDVLNYKPERRYVARLVRPDGEVALAKFYSRGGYARAHAISRKLNVSRNALYPETMGRSKKYAVVAYRWQPGTTLRQLNIEGRVTPSSLTATAGSLAAFHASGGHGLSLPAPAEQNGRLFALAEQLGFLLPELEQRARSVALRLSRWLDGQKSVYVPVHGDFYDKQVVIDHEKARLIDFDAAQLGNPLLDLGSYIAHLENMVSSYGVSCVDVSKQKDILVTEYEKLMNTIDPVQLNRYVALGLFSLIHHPFRSWVTDWPDLTEKLLSRVESLFSP